MKKTTQLKSSQIKPPSTKRLDLMDSSYLKIQFFFLLALLGSFGLFAQQYHLKTDIKGWKAASGGYVNDLDYTDGATGENTGITITPSYQVKPKAKMKNEDDSEYSTGYIQLRAKDKPATILFPPYIGVKSFKVNIIASGVNRKITLFNGTDSLTTFEGIGKTGVTYTYEIPDDKQADTFNFILKGQNSVIYICEIAIEKTGGTAVILPRSISKIYSSEGEIHFEASVGERVEVYNLLGQLLYNGIVTSGLNSIRQHSGVYIVKVGSTAEKIFVK